MSKRILPGALGGLGILLMILDSKTAILGARDGIELCLRSVIPSIFPFLVLTGMLTPAICSAKLPLLRPLSRILGIPIGSEGIFLTGMIGGYPAGAQSVHQAWKSGQLNTADAHRMLAFCSNAGPSFLFGILCTKFDKNWILWLLWGIHIISALAVAVVFPGKSAKENRHFPAAPVTLPQALKKAVTTMGVICGWVVLFRILIAILDRWCLWLLPVNAQIAIYGVLELANGCCSADLIPTAGLRFILCSGMLAFGGICVALQTASVTGELGLGKYMQGKLLQTIFSILLSMTVQYFLFAPAEKLPISPVFPAIILIFLLLFRIIPLKRKNRGSNPSLIGV